MHTETPLPLGAVAWRSRDGAGGIVPGDASVDLVLREDRLFIAGPSTHWFRASPDGDEGTAGIRLPPGDGAVVLPGSLAALRDRVVPAEDLLRTADRTRWTEILRHWLVDTDPRRPDLPVRPPGWVGLVRGSAERSLPAGVVATELGWSARTFRRRMHGQFGMGYATLVRVRRAQRGLTALRAGVPPGEAAQRAGYADQPHLSREARRVLGASPAQLLVDSANRSMELPSGSSTVA